MIDEERKWLTDPIKKFGDIAPLEVRVRRNLPPLLPYNQPTETAELQMRREADARFRVKKTG